jgi:hypothetical protein
MRTYRIRVGGRLGAEWSAWFDGLTVTGLPDGETMLSGLVADQAALHGILNRIRDLGLVLLSLSSPDQGREDERAWDL